MNIKKIQELVQLMSDNDLTEIEIDQEGMKIRLIKKPYGAVEQQMIPVAVPQSVPAVSAAGATEAAAAKPVGTSEILSPMVGTFYRAASPEEGPYVQVGDVIHKGDVLCIIEAMKLMNEVKSECNGRIVSIPAENAEPVGFGQPIFIIEPI